MSFWILVLREKYWQFRRRVYRAELRAPLGFRQSVYDALCFHAHADDSGQQLERVGGVLHDFQGEAVGVVDDAAGFVRLDALSFHDPGDGRLSIRGL